MNKKQVLTILGCSGSIVLSSICGEAALANTADEYVFTAPDTQDELAEIPASKIDYPFYDCSCSEYDTATAEEIDREGEKAIASFGCDCAGCRRLVSSLEKPSKVRPDIFE